MNMTKSKKCILINAIVWAALILALAILLKANEQMSTILIFIIGGWYISHANILKALQNKSTDSEQGEKSNTCC